MESEEGRVDINTEVVGRDVDGSEEGQIIRSIVLTHCLAILKGNKSEEIDELALQTHPLKLNYQPLTMMIG